MDKDLTTTVENSEKEKSIVGAEGKPLKKKKTHPMKEYFLIGEIVFLVVAACILFGVCVYRIDEVLMLLHKLGKIFEPITCGLIFAYLMNPMMNKVEKFVARLFEKMKKDKKSVQGLIRGISIGITVVLAILLIAILLYMVLPELITTITNVIQDLPVQITKFINWANELSINEKTDGKLERVLTDVRDYIIKWAKTVDLKNIEISEKMGSIFSTVTVGVFGVFKIVEDIFIGLIVSIYILSNKEKFSGQSKKMAYAFFSEKTANTMLEMVRETHQIFTGFIIGKVIDSAIIGVICFVSLTILRMPYTLLVSVIVGVTNIIPFFGPYIGGAISVILILLSNPKAGIVFIIFVIILQQIDGNLIGPKILGESTGLSAFWVIFSILVGSGLFGFVGMIFGVPTFAVIYHLLKKSAEKKLEKKKLPIESEEYCNLEYIQGNKVLKKEQE